MMIEGLFYDMYVFVQDCLVNGFEFELLMIDGYVCCGCVKFNYGMVEMLIFMLVGMYGIVKVIQLCELYEIKVQIIFGNMFYLWLCLGFDMIDVYGGLYGFMGWNKLILIDLGGFQVFLFGDLCKIIEDGVMFVLLINGDKLFLLLEVLMQIQKVLNFDVVMQFDECMLYVINGVLMMYQEVVDLMCMLLCWVKCLFDEFNWFGNLNVLFGIVQGGMFEDLCDELFVGFVEFGFYGFVIGGLLVGELKEDMMCVLCYVGLKLLVNKLYYLMGVGMLEDLVEGVVNGVDMFDCVMLICNVCNGWLFMCFGDVKICNVMYKNLLKLFDLICICYMCQNFLCGYLYYLYWVGEIFGVQLNMIYNLYYYLQLMSEICEVIEMYMFDVFW